VRKATRPKNKITGEGGMERIASRWGTAAKEGDEGKKEREMLD